MNELHQKLAVLSFSLNSTSPQQLGEAQQQLQQPPPDTVSQMVVDSSTSFGQQQLQPQHQMQTVVVNPISSNASSSPIVLNVAVNNTSSQISGTSPAISGLPMHSNFNSSVDVPVAMHPLGNQQLPAGGSVAHPNILSIATQSPFGINSSSPVLIHHHHHPQQLHHHPINELASNSMTSTPPTTNSSVTTNKLIEAVTNQGASGPMISVSIDRHF